MTKRTDFDLMPIVTLMIMVSLSFGMVVYDAWFAITPYLLHNKETGANKLTNCFNDRWATLFVGRKTLNVLLLVP